MDVQQLITDAEELGTWHGQAAGTWVIEDEDQAAMLRRWIDDGDPRLDEVDVSPLSGEWADTMTPTALAQELDADEVDDEICASYEEAFRSAYWEQIERDIAMRLDV